MALSGVEGALVLDELGDRLLAEAASHVDDRLDDEIVGLAARAAHELAVDLEEELSKAWDVWREGGLLRIAAGRPLSPSPKRSVAIFTVILGLLIWDHFGLLVAFAVVIATFAAIGLGVRLADKGDALKGEER